MTFEAFEQAVHQAEKNLPVEFKKLLRAEGIKILVREQVSPAIRNQYARSIVFGLFVGVSRKDRSAFMVQTEPTRIEIYQESFEQAYGPELSQVMLDEIRKTVIHEIAHYFGFDEKQIRDRGF